MAFRTGVKKFGRFSGFMGAGKASWNNPMISQILKFSFHSEVGYAHSNKDLQMPISIPELEKTIIPSEWEIEETEVTPQEKTFQCLKTYDRWKLKMKKHRRQKRKKMLRSMGLLKTK
mmetsp:Transcript_47653/g.54879  ORF Transcript_47653/g.54879 Transcript_47653/m.54879 type:complete len:117 (+) Transcript_47653:37-387(+)|eukprot:CAMPEP_0114990598 /NCGR_PEP_ID=MMETSP0216-20121206/10893_1 /TAXON_ID=223996 /ORGANISM="Protocruzia adherens, Strain Boccale" /LENGTH=116 /DNA_ID=CAMNT_0002353807 /DNA_START=18 /DNA_END=368 /DNA_ORIENTATION=-